MSVSIAVPLSSGVKPYKSLSNEELSARIEKIRREMGPSLMILGHHYQQDEVIEHSDLRGDSYQLSQMAAASGECRNIVFCGVHFMAETADILANQPEKVAARPGWDAIPAVRDGELHEIKSPLILQPGPAALTDGLQRLRQIIDGWARQHA